MAAFGKVAQWSQPVLHTSKHAELMNLACKSAILNRGVSHLIFPDEVQTLPAAEGASAGGPKGRIAPRMPSGRRRTPSSRSRYPIGQPIEAAGDHRRPWRPFRHAGGARARGVAERAPVITTFKAKGLVSDHHPLGCGVLGRSGTPIASWFMNESDCLLVLGASFSNHTGISPKVPTIQVDFDPMALGKFHAVDVPVWGEISVTVEDPEAASSKGRITRSTHGPRGRRKRWRIWRTEKQRRQDDARGQGVNSASIFAAMTRQVAADAIIAVDVGNNTYSFGRYFECDRQAILMSGYLGSIGFSLPAAMGAWAATQEDDPRFAGRQVVSMSGDGGFGQYLGDSHHPGQIRHEHHPHPAQQWPAG